MHFPKDFPALSDIKTVAAALDLNYHTVRNWTYGTKKSPPAWPKAVRLGRSVRYRREDLEAFVENLQQKPADHHILPDSSLKETKIIESPGKRGRPDSEETIIAQAAGLTVAELRLRVAEIKSEKVLLNSLTALPIVSHTATNIVTAAETASNDLDDSTK